MNGSLKISQTVSGNASFCFCSLPSRYILLGLLMLCNKLSMNQTFFGGEKQNIEKKKRCFDAFVCVEHPSKIIVTSSGSKAECSFV